MLEKPEDLISVLKAQNIYQHQSELYELAYARFQSTSGTSHFEKAIRSLALPASSEALDLCCGTGASTRMVKQLFTSVDFADGSASMLAVAERALGAKGTRCQLPDLSGLSQKKYDLITLRQAFNYVSPQERTAFFGAVRTRLKRGGWLVFNTFKPKANGVYPPLRSKLEGERTLVLTEERNIITETVVTHSQRSEVLDFDHCVARSVIDINTFYQHDPERLANVLKICGFTVKMSVSGNSVVLMAKNDALT